MTDTQDARLTYLRGRLFSPGTNLGDVPPDQRGLTLKEWQEYCRLTLAARCEEWRRAQPTPEYQPVTHSPRQLRMAQLAEWE